MLSGIGARLKGAQGGNKAGRLRASAVAPIALIVAVAVICVVVAALSSAQRADDVALQKERQLFTNVIADRRAEVMRELEQGVSNGSTAPHAWNELDLQWVHARLGLRLRTFFGHNHVFMFDSADRPVYALTGRTRVDPKSFGDALGGLSTMMDELRGRRAPDAPGEFEWARVDPLTDILRPTRTARVQTFMGRPAIVAAIVLAPESGAAAAAPEGPPPVIIVVSYLYDTFLNQVSARLDLPGLRMMEREPPDPDDNVYELTDGRGNAVARFAWTPNRPGAAILRNVLPFIGIALGSFALLAGLALRYMRRTATAIAEGEDRLRHLAMHDPLSGLPNRTYFGERLAAAIDTANRDDSLAAVLSIDLDHFKDINDTLGHHVGDGLIRAVAHRLARALRTDDLVSRLGGDEFAVITVGVTDIEALDKLADRLITMLRAPYGIMGHTLVVGASIGIALIDRCSGEAADIMRRADVALYRAKNEGRNRACIYDADMDADLRERKQLENDLRTAIATDGLSVAYQPIMNASGEKMIGVEALCRWNHPERGEIPPSVFIPIAERCELIIPLGEWVLQRSCIEAKAWPVLTLAVNVSPLQFRRQDFVEVVQRILAETGFDPLRLEIELTETTLLGNVDEAEQAMKRLKAIGVKLALDDFGTGYSSLLYLRRFPFDRIKIDRSFVRSIEIAADAASIVHAIVSLGRGLAMKVTAEGVETAEQQLFLRAAGVHSMQGFRFGKPVPAASITERIATSSRSTDQESRATALAS